MKQVPLLRARVQDFQSIADTAVDFGRFTVLVGPSNSGKSAFLRGLRACLRNTIVPANVRQGTSKAVVSVTFEDGAVEIQRGKSLSTYRLLADGTEQVYTKSGRTVPDDVAAFISLPSIGGTDATFAFQFDKPFLLAEPGAQVAGVLGSLTNVSMLHAAVREANRRRSEASHLLKTRTADVIEHTSRLGAYADLPARKEALDWAEFRLNGLQEAQERLAALTRHIDTLHRTEAVLQAVTPTPPPDVTARLDALTAQHQRLRDLTLAIDQARALTARLRTLALQAREHRDAARTAEAEHARALAAQPTCRTCGQPIPEGAHP